MKFKEYLTQMDEALITFGNRPKFGQVVLLAGGAGSGKGFISGKILGIQGKTFDVDNLKEKIKSEKTPKLNKKIYDKYGIDVTTLNLKNPDNVALLHRINDEMGISKKEQKQFFDNLSKDPRKLPNIIFDTTMKSEKKINDLVKTVKDAGYQEKNIHIVWILTDVEIAKEQNLSRPRMVPEDILMQTHRGVSETMSKLMRNSTFQNYVDGYVYVVFNKKGVDSTLVFSKFGGEYLKDVLILNIKKPGKKPKTLSQIGNDFIDKIKSYIPKDTMKFWK